MAGIDRWLHYTVTTIDRFHCTYTFVKVAFLKKTYSIHSVWCQYYMLSCLRTQLCVVEYRMTFVKPFD